MVDTQRQRIFAYENGQLVRSHLTSTGRSETPTVLGDYRIYIKYEKTNMSGADYFLPDVPYTMYFYQGYGIHGTYWHNSFGRPMSHGCVNLPTDEAQWFFSWAEVGTLVSGDINATTSPKTGDPAECHCELQKHGDHCGQFPYRVPLVDRCRG